jgi:hypothetical protein
VIWFVMCGVIYDVWFMISEVPGQLVIIVDWSILLH